MNKEKLTAMLRLLAIPGLLMLLGVILVINPNAASALIAKILGWCLILGAVVIGISAIFQDSGRVARGIFAVGLAVVGGWLRADPLMLAAWVGRVIGLLILVNSLTDLIYAKYQNRNFLLHAIAAIIGAVLLLMPMNASRIIFRLCGLVVLCIGTYLLLQRLRNPYALDAPEEPDDPNIIDAL